MSDTPLSTETLPHTPPSFPDVPLAQDELGNLASSFAQAMLGPFEVIDVIGQGGMGIVFSGRHVDQGVDVAIKVITRQGAERPRLREVMRNEVRAVAELDHPGIVRVLDYGDIPPDAEHLTDGVLRAGSPYFVMEYAQYGSLLNVVGRVTWRQAKAILLNLLDALAHSHARDVIHRDIKPGNILLDTWGGQAIPRLADFGLAFATETATDISRSIGTPQYMAPEQIETPWRQHGPWSDLYSLGCFAYELLSGTRLFRGRSVVQIFRLHLDGVRKPLRSIVSVPDSFDGWLHRMLERYPANRFQSAAEAAEALEALDDSQVEDTRPPQCIEHEIARLTPVLGEPVNPRPSEFMWPQRHPVSMKLVGAGRGLFGLREIPLAGRRDELAALWSAFRAVDHDEPSIVVLRGAHGSGKTKLADAFAHRLVELGAAVPMWAAHNGSDQVADASARMIARWLRAAGASRVEASRIIRDAFDAEPDSRYLRDGVLSLIEPTLVGAAANAESFQFASSAQRHDIVARAMAQAARRRPILAVLDDAHLSEETLEFAAALLQTPHRLPALVVVTICDEELAQRPGVSALVDALEERERVQTIALEPLNEVAHLRFVKDLLLLGGELAIGVADRTHGNPGLAVALMNEWINGGQLEVGETGFVLRDGARLLEQLPTSGHEVWRNAVQEIVASLSEQDRMSLEIAAALGFEISAEEWVAICLSAEIDPSWDAVGELVGRRLARNTLRGFRFVHPGTVEVLRESAESADRWMRWKRRCAEQLEATGDREKPDDLERIGAYWLEAEEPAHAIAPLRYAAELRLRTGQYRRAERAARGVVRALGNDAREVANIDLLRSRIYMGTGDSDEALRWARKALTTATRNDWNDILVRATGFCALAKQWLGESDADEWLNEALNLLDAADDADLRADGLLMILGYQLTSLGRLDDAKAVLDRDRELALAANDERALASNAYQQCRLHLYRREYDRGLRCGEDARRRFAEAGNLHALSAVLDMMAELRRLKGDDLDLAARMHRESIALAQRIGRETWLSEANLGLVLVAQAHFHEAEKHFMMAAKGAEAAGRRRSHVTCLAGLLTCAVERGAWTSAEQLFPAIESFCAETREAEIDLAELLEHAGDAYRRSGRVSEATRAWELARTLWDTLDADDRIRTLDDKISNTSDA